jgi:lipopolysaccharide transport system ATP-binding protein
MSDIVISVENLSKCYLIGHQTAQRERYTALRDVIGRETRNFVRKAADLLHGKQIVQGDEVEESWALRNLSFEVKQGEILGIIGRNGAGKSTLLKILSRITEPTEGRVRLRGRVGSLLEVGTGFHPELTGRENIFLNGAILGMAYKEITRKFDEIVAFAEIEKFLDTPVKRYSSGMYVRLAFAVAAHLEPEILIVDEVLAVGDAEFQKKCLGKMGEIAERGGRTVLFVSHQLGMVSRLCSRAILLNGGRLVFNGPSSTTIDNYVAQGARNSGPALSNDLRFPRVPPAITLIEALGSGGIPTGEFAWHDPIRVRVQFLLDKRIRGTLLGVAIDNRHATRVTTWVARLADHFPENATGGELELEISPRIIAPGGYTFTVALFEPGVAVYHQREGECPFVIVDTGSELAAFDSLAYGVTIIPARWSVGTVAPLPSISTETVAP